jgi:hypothetical protein
MRQCNRVIWAVLLGFSAITFIIGVSLGKGRGASFEVSEAVLTPEGISIYDLTKEAPIQVVLEMNEAESLELNTEGQEAVVAFWSEYLQQLTEGLAIATNKELYRMQYDINSVTMLFVSWSYPNLYQLVIEADGQTFSREFELALPQPQESSQHFEIQRLSFGILFRDERILSTFEHSLASPKWYTDPELRKEIHVDKQVVKNPQEGLITVTFTDIDGGTTTIEARMPLPSTRAGARLERAISLLRWYSYVMLNGYIYSLLETGQLEPALSHHDRLSRTILRIKTKRYDWAGDLIINVYVEVPFIPPPPLQLIYFFCF